ncbi:MAG: nucleotidyltransferase family protein [Candidatus Eremiobacteraeota bacterium]|nr:nucleotidyltransferase family protein [Candidatus Eremiobacteraeota bacterium]
MNVTAVVLAAGESNRMGEPKLLLEIGGTPMLARVLAACAHLPRLVVASPNLRPFVEASGVRCIANDRPEAGMAHSIALADAATEAESALLVLLGDKPLVSRALVDAVLEGARGFDICFPEHDGIGGHPVFFSARARERLAQIPIGDSLRLLRDDPTLRRRALPIEDIGAYADVDDPASLRRARGYANREHPSPRSI